MSREILKNNASRDNLIHLYNDAVCNVLYCYNMITYKYKTKIQQRHVWRHLWTFSKMAVPFLEWALLFISWYQFHLKSGPTSDRLGIQLVKHEGFMLKVCFVFICFETMPCENPSDGRNGHVGKFLALALEWSLLTAWAAGVITNTPHCTGCILQYHYLYNRHGMFTHSNCSILACI